MAICGQLFFAAQQVGFKLGQDGEQFLKIRGADVSIGIRACRRADGKDFLQYGMRTAREVEPECPSIIGIAPALYQTVFLQFIQQASERYRLDLQQVSQINLLYALVAGQMQDHAALLLRHTKTLHTPIEVFAQQPSYIVDQESKSIGYFRCLRHI